MKMRNIGILAALILGQTAYAGTITYFANLTGAAEVPPTGSTGTGTATVIINTTTNMMEVQVAFSGLSSATTASHIHCCTTVPDLGNAGVATTTPSFPGFPLGVTSGAMDMTYDLTLASSYNPSFVTAQGGLANAETALLSGMAAGETYLNIHTQIDPGGEIRGYLAPAAATPEPATFLMAGTALAGVALLRRRRSAR